MKPDEPYRLILQAIARLETKVIDGGKDVAAIKGELRKIAPRLDTLSAEVHEVARLVHRHAEVTQGLTNEAAEVVRSVGFLEERVRKLRDSVADELGPSTPKEVPTKPERGE